MISGCPYYHLKVGDSIELGSIVFYGSKRSYSSDTVTPRISAPFKKTPLLSAKILNKPPPPSPPILWTSNETINDV